MFSLECHGCNVGAKEVVVAKWASIKQVDNPSNGWTTLTTLVDNLALRLAIQ